MEDSRLKAFVAHRVAEILEASTVQQWRHVNGSLIPADDVSRGLSATALSGCQRWLVGPPFLQLDEHLWPRSGKIVMDVDDPEVINSPRVIAAVAQQNDNRIIRLFDKVSSLKRCIRVVAYVYRFLRRAAVSVSIVLTANEIENALTKCISVFQRSAFPEEFGMLKEGIGQSEKSKLISLDPFLDGREVIRVGGRLRHAIGTDINRHPAVIPANCSLVHRLVWQRHVDLMHSRTERVLADLRAEYWIMGGRRTVRRIIDRCYYCRRMNAKPCQQLMAPLPRDRLCCAAPAFTNVGVDFFGPFEVVIGRKRVKRYGCIFTCLVSRASHLEITHSLDAQSFILALRRFVARRGQPSVIYSDNGRNFVATVNALSEVLTVENWTNVDRFLADRRIQWKFLPPAGPHMGGTWERLIGVAKRALISVLSGNAVTDEVLLTVFAEAESLLNGRPLAYMGSDVSNPLPLTPFHLLTGRTNVYVPSDIGCSEQCSWKKHWQHAQVIVDRFWRRWQRELLPTLQRRAKWTIETPDLKVDDVVIIIDPNSPRGRWPLGRIIEVFRGKDGRVRVVKVKTSTGIYKRPISRLALLEPIDKPP